MSTYNIEVRGIKVIGNITQDEVQEKLRLVRGIVWTTGGNDQDIKIIINSITDHCKE